MKKTIYDFVSAFDGVSCGQLALEKSGVEYGNYYASEIEKESIQVTQRRFPNTIQIGDITNVNTDGLPKKGVLIGGSPCQTFSRSGDNTGFDGKSGLFYEFLRLKNELKPEFFLLENVVMKKEWQHVISEHMGVEPVLIDSKDFSAQKRQRLYWTNIPISEFEDKNILIKDILDPTNQDIVKLDSDFLWFEDGEHRVRNATKKGYLPVKNYDVVNLDFPTSKTRRGRVSHLKSNTLNTGCNQGVFVDGNIIRFNALECERLQTIEDGHTDGFSQSKRKKMIGNAWTVDVIAHILKGLL